MVQGTGATQPRERPRGCRSGPGLSLRLQLLQVARLAPRLLGESSDLVRDFLRRQITLEGAGCDRAGRPDLYYTIFALAGMQALDVPVPLDRVRIICDIWTAARLRASFGAGPLLVHRGKVAPSRRARAGCCAGSSSGNRGGGYDGDRKAALLTYGTVRAGAYQDLGKMPPSRSS